MMRIRVRLLNAKTDVRLWGWRSPGRRVLLIFVMVCVTTLLIFLGQMAGSWLGVRIGELGAAFGMLVGGVIGFLAGALIAESFGVSFRHRCSL